MTITCILLSSMQHSGVSQLNQNVVIIAMAISMAVLAVATFLLGFLCGHFSHKYQLCKKRHDQTPKHTSVHYGSKAVADLNEQDPSELEMMDNVAYGPIKHQRRYQQQ